MRFPLFISLQLLFFIASAQNKWTAIMTQGGEAQSYNSFYTEAAVEEFIRAQANKNNVISELVYGDGKWHAVATYKKEGATISWKFEKEFPSAWISGQWDAGKHISKVTWGDGKWAVVMTTKDSYTKQSWGARDSWDDLEKWFKTKWNENTKYNVIDIAWGNGKWYGIMGVTTVYETQSIKASEEFPSKWIQEKYNAKYNITAIESDGKKWYVVMTKKATQKSETVLNPGNDFPESDIKKQWDKERRISGLVYVDTKTKKEKELAEEDLDLFEAFLKSAAADNKGTYQSYTNSAQEKLDKKDYAGAISDFEKALALDKTSETVWNNLAWAKYLTGSCSDALSDVNKSTSIKNTYFNNHTKASILKCQGKCAEALTYFNEAIRLYRIEFGKIGQMEYYADRAAAKRCMGNYSGALDDIELALAIEPNNTSLKTSAKELTDLVAGK